MKKDLIITGQVISRCVRHNLKNKNTYWTAISIGAGVGLSTNSVGKGLAAGALAATGSIIRDSYDTVDDIYRINNESEED